MDIIHFVFVLQIQGLAPAQYCQSSLRCMHARSVRFCYHSCMSAVLNSPMHLVLLSGRPQHSHMVQCFLGKR
jgi:hypothetical protein